MVIIAHLRKRIPSYTPVTTVVQAVCLSVRILSDKVRTRVQRGQEEEGEAISGSHGRQGIGSRTRGHAAGGKDRHRKEKEARKIQADSE